MALPARYDERWMHSLRGGRVIDKVDKTLAVLYRYEIHAFILLLTGVGLYLHGVKDQGQVIIGAALLVFKGRQT